MSVLKIVYESATRWDSIFIKNYLRRNIPVWVIEPFHSYHHKKGIRFFPPHLPASVEKLIKNGKVLLLRADEIKAKEIYLLSADKAVDVIELVYPKYRKKYGELFQYVSKTLESSVAENVFKINLCNRLAEFYSVNIMLHRIEQYLSLGPIMVYPDINVYSYLFIKSLLLESNQEFYEHPNIRFSVQARVTSFLENMKQNLIITAKLCAQTLASGLFGSRHPSAEKKFFSYGITIMGERQLWENQRGPDFIIDNEEILPGEVVYFPQMIFKKNQQEILGKLPGQVYHLPKVGRYFSHFPGWKGLLWHALKKNLLRNYEELSVASIAFFYYFRWKRVLEYIEIKHLITHGDFGIGHVGRNIALNQAGVQTWYFTDSMNHAVNLKEEKKCDMHHPFWAYLSYDHLVTWDDALAQYFKEHPGSFKETHVVGCLWSGHLQGKNQERKLRSEPSLKIPQDYFVLAAFDTSYSRNGITSYAEGLAFAMHLLQLVDDYPDIYIILKEKKDRSTTHFTSDPILGPKLLEIYNKMGSHPRIKIYSNQVDASELISISDMAVSFPFTSTTFEALSVNRPAIWHDPLGYYVNTLYGKVGGVTTHNYEALKAKILEIKEMKSCQYQNPIPINSPLMDPFRDGKAIERFRKLLTSS
jgi:hypothetical protein